MNIGKIALVSLVLPIVVLAQNPEIMVSPQGLAQRDLSIRGSSYTGAGIALNGVLLKVPYSAHFNAALPVRGLALSDAAARSGFANIPGFLNGTLDYTLQPPADQSRLSLELGTKESFRSSLFSSTETVGGFLEAEKARQIDYAANDLEQISGGGIVRFSRDDWQFNLLAAGQSQVFGAQGYYGIPASVHAEERTEDLLLLGTAFKGDMGGTYMRAGASLRQFDDEYRIPSAMLENDTRSAYGSLMLEGRTLEIQRIALFARGDVEHERIGGDLGSHFRTRGSLMLLPEVRLDRITLKGGFNTVFQSDESPEWLPQAGIDFFATDNIKLYAAYTESVAQPDFQSLFLADPYHVPNGDLALQHARGTELGIHQFVSSTIDWKAAVFHRTVENAGDWVKGASTDMAWSAVDLGNLDMLGVEGSIQYQLNNELGLQLRYQGLQKDDYGYHAGLYELDYPEHLLGFAGFWRISEEIRFSAAQTLRWQNENAARTGDDFGADASLGLQYTPRFANNATLSFLVENLWDSDFQPMPGLKPRPLSVSSGITVDW